MADVTVAPLANPLSYGIPAHLKDTLAVGMRVHVPLGKRTVEGFVVGKKKEPASVERPYALKSISSFKSPEAAFDPDQLEFLNWISRYYSEPLSSIIELAVPKRTPPKITKMISPTDQREVKLGDSQKLILEYLRGRGATTLSELRSLHKSATTLVNALQKKGLVNIHSSLLRVSEELYPKAVTYNPVLPDLNLAQREVTNALLPSIASHTYQASLLHGVTGSGKTEVYVHLIETAMRSGFGSLVLVPEISLTPQLVDRLEDRLGGKIAVLHSALSLRERWGAWEALLDGKMSVALGARSALFAPIKNLGLIIVDEEHDGSFKQGEGIRYNARDLAIARAKLVGCPILLGSATPSLESFHHSQTKNYEYLALQKRHHDQGIVHAEIVDMGKIKAKDLPSPSLSPKLYELLKETLENKTQAFILYNKRGFASYLQCSACAFTLSCPYCSVTLTYHQRKNMLLCHYCGHSLVPPLVCNECGGIPESEEQPIFAHRGAGTEKVFEELKSLFPQANIGKLDRDSATDLEEYRKILKKVRDGETNILVGTQMIAKGHDLDRVTLVGVIDCDVGLHVPDFRSGERVFQLLTQASGRAGRRDLTSHVILQTRSPKHPSLVYALRRDSVGFIQHDLKLREELSYPPHARLLRVIVLSEDPAAAHQGIERLAGALKNSDEVKTESVRLLGPVPAPLGRLRGEWRWHLLLKSKRISHLLSLMSAGKRFTTQQKKIRVIFDLDPQDML